MLPFLTFALLPLGVFAAAGVAPRGVSGTLACEILSKILSSASSVQFPSEQRCDAVLLVLG